MHHNNLKFTIQVNAYILFVLLLFLVPLQWLFAWMIAVLIHELCHYLSVLSLGGSVLEITVGAGGVHMQSGAMPRWKSFAAILGGPLGGAFPVFLGSSFPRLAICCWALTVYNLLPLSFLDGGHALRLLIRNKKYIQIVEYVVLSLLLSAAIYFCFFLQMGIFPLVIVALLWVRNRNKTCKAFFKKVQ